MSTESTEQPKLAPDSTVQPWWKEITPYMWVVLIIACLGWIFDVYEGQIFVSTMEQSIPDLLPADAPSTEAARYEGYALGVFLAGGALGGVLFGMLSDRIGRVRTMMLTILMYAGFTGLTAFVQAPWQMVALRFLVAMGVGGEWAVASAMVAEVMPQRARARLLGVFHASSVFGTYLAIGAGQFIVNNDALKNASGVAWLGWEDGGVNWRLAFLVGVVPALLTVWIRLHLREPEGWARARERAREDTTQKTGAILDLFKRQHIRGTMVGMTLAAVGLATFWGAHVYGKNLMMYTAERPYAAVLPDYLVENENQPKQAVLDGEIDGMLENVPVDENLEQEILLGYLLGSWPETAYVRQQKFQTLERDFSEVPAPEDVEIAADASATERIKAICSAKASEIKSAEMLGMFLNTTGGGIGLVLFGFFAERFGRRGTFRFYHIGAVLAVFTLFWFMPVLNVWAYCILLPIFGFLTLGMHAGYAVYFPELFPTRLRGTGGGFCFNFGRIIACPILFIRGWMQSDWGFTLEGAVTTLGLLYLLGIVILFFAPETKGKELPE